jgi:hypothetical protein
MRRLDYTVQGCGQALLDTRRTGSSSEEFFIRQIRKQLGIGRGKISEYVLKKKFTIYLEGVALANALCLASA